jgi:branched-chain amino acid transport system permease protein
MPRLWRGLGFVGGAVAFYLVVDALWAPPAGIIAQGALLGGLTSLLAIGIALVYRAQRIVNFAAGDLGAVPGALAVLLVVSSGASWLLAFCTGIVASLALGAFIELLVVRRFFRAPRLSLTVATIGLAQVLAGIGLLLPNWFTLTTPPQVPFPSPIHASLTINPITFGGNDLIAVIVIVVAFGGLAVFLRTRHGIAMRGCAENADRAALLGIPVRRIHTLVWTIASCLAFLAVFLRAGIVGLPIGTVLGPPILLRALAAAVIGRMERLPTIAIAAIALGIVEQAVFWHLGNELYVDPVLFVIVLGALLLTPRGSGLRRGIEPSSWRAIREPRPVPPALNRTREVRFGFAAIAVIALGALCAVPAFLDESHTSLAAIVLIYALIGLSLVVLTGWGGEISLGQMAFVAVGGAVGGSITARLGWDLAPAMLIGGAIGAGVATLIGLPALRRRGLTIAVVTLAFALATTSWLLNPQIFGPGTRFNWLPPEQVNRADVFGFIDVGSETRFYYLCLVVLVLAAIAVLGIRRARSGRVLVAIRENEQAASAYGVNPRPTLMAGFAVSGFLAGLAGVLFVQHENGLQLASYSAAESLVVFAMAVIGGLGSIPGALLGALYVRGANYFLPVEWQIIATGAGMVLVLVVFSGGLGAVLADARDALLRRVARRRGLDVPSLIGDTAAAAEHRPARGDRPATATTAPILAVHNLDVAYDGVQVLFGVDLAVGPGEAVALLGTNGSGKSTLLRAISGLARPEQGTILFSDTDTTRARPETIAAAGAVQSPGAFGVFPSLTVAENLRLARWLRRDVTAADAVTRRVLAAFPMLQQRLRERAGNLSGGEQQLLTLAMAFVAEPKLLMIDELSLGLSPALIDTVVEHVRALQAHGIAVLVVDQSVELALRIAERAYFLEKGTVRFAGPTAELLDHPELVRAVFLGTSSTATTTPPPVPPESTPALALRHITKRFGGIVALDDVSLTVSEHEIVGVVGPNGAGKTTLFDVVSGFTRADTGTVELQTPAGFLDMTRMAPYRRARLGLGRSFQDGRLFPALTVRETVEVALERDVKVKSLVAAACHLPAAARSEASVRARAEQLLAQLGLTDFTDKFVHELSTGTRRLVDLACALAHQPSVLLLDEPSSGIAQSEAAALAPVLRNVHDTLGTSMLVIEHDLTLLAALADRLVVLDVGAVIADGDPARVLDDPSVIRAYLGRGAGSNEQPAG